MSTRLHLSAVTLIIFAMGCCVPGDGAGGAAPIINTCTTPNAVALVRRALQLRHLPGRERRDLLERRQVRLRGHERVLVEHRLQLRLAQDVLRSARVFPKLLRLLRGDYHPLRPQHLLFDPRLRRVADDVPQPRHAVYL